MKTQIQCIHFIADEQLKNLILEKVYSLQKIYKRIESCIITLRLDKNNKNKNKVVEINMNIPGTRLFVIDQAEKFEVAASLAIDEMKRQLLKKKEELRQQLQKNKVLLQEKEKLFL